MSNPARCASSRLVERHFTGRIHPADERLLREHLPSCAGCRRLYERHLVLARLDPTAPSAEERLARGLGVRRAPRAWLPFAGLATAAVAVMIFMVVQPGADSLGGYAARGHGADVGSNAAQLQVFRLRAGGPAEPVAGFVHASDELAFAYANPGGQGYLMVFAVDDTGAIYWYVPAWTEPSSNPRSLAIAPGAGLHEVGEAVTHQLGGRRVTVHALFTGTALGAQEVERLLARAPGGLSLLGRPHLELELEVRP